MKVCGFEGCGRPHKARGWCSTHYDQWRKGKPLRPITGTGNTPVTPEAAELDVEEFEFLLSTGELMERALERMGVCGRTMCRRYQLLGRPIPAGLWSLASQYFGRESAA